jgi:putative protease
MMPILEDEHGTYIMNSKDLRAVEHVERLMKIGVDSLKVEGRTKSLYYVARTAQVYRRAINDVLAGRPFNPELLSDLEGLASRGYTDGFYQRHHTQDYQNYMKGHSESNRSQYVGEVVGRAPGTGWAVVEVKNRFQVGDRLEVILPDGNQIVELQQMTSSDGLPLQIASGNGYTVHIPLAGNYDKALLARFL